jgi:LacI family transcriptional regulator
MITIKEIARQANLSIGTVDRVLHGRGDVAKKTEEKIKAIIKKTGYKTNIHASNLSMKATHEIGVIMPIPHQDGGYWEMLQNGIDQATGELTSFNVHRRYFFFDKYSEDSFLEAGGKALERNMAGLVITPVLCGTCRSFVESIPPEVPYVYVDSTIPDTTPLTCIGQNSFQSGVCGAQLMEMLIGKKRAVVCLRILPDDFHINERVRGFADHYGKVSDVHVYDVSGSLNNDDFIDFVASVNREVPDCRGFFVTNAETHRVAKALRSLKVTGKRIIGYDCIEENKRLVEEGTIDFIISQNTEKQGYMGINTLYRYLVLKETCSKEVSMPIDIVMKGNLSNYQ